MGNYQKFYKAVMYLDNFTCVYCGKRAASMTIDHLIAQSKGGPDVLDNLVACCGSCNSSKNDSALHEWGFPQFGRFAKGVDIAALKSGLPVHTREPAKKRKSRPSSAFLPKQVTAKYVAETKPKTAEYYSRLWASYSSAILDYIVIMIGWLAISGLSVGLFIRWPVDLNIAISGVFFGVLLYLGVRMAIQTFLENQFKSARKT